MEIKYIPIIRTLAAELRGFDNLPQNLKNKLIPFFELTRGRTHKSLYPSGNIAKSYEAITNVYPNGRFFFDVTGQSNLSNSDIDELSDETNGYKKWINYLSSLNRCDDIIASIQIDLDTYNFNDNLKHQIESLKNICYGLFLRVDIRIATPDEIENIVNYIKTEFINYENFWLFFDCAFIVESEVDGFANEIIKLLKKIRKNDQFPRNVVIASSSFPKYVVREKGKGESDGTLKLIEIELFNKISKSLLNSFNFIYSDYSSVHPIKNEGGGGGWIPRIDIPTSSEIFYYRTRREDGGYKTIAPLATSDYRFPVKINCWGVDQIKEASNGSSPGNSPSYWIAVRVNIHLHTQALRLGII